MAGLGSQIAEYALRVLVAAFNRRAGKTDERRLGQRIAHVLGEATARSLAAWLKSMRSGS